MSKVTVIGAGPGGYQAAVRAAQLGAQVKLIEREKPGGTCLHWGCIPTKTLKASADALTLARRLSEYGVNIPGEPTPDLAAMMARKQAIIDGQVTGLERLFKSYGIQLIQAQARLMGPGRLVLTSGDDTSEITSDKIILATGSSPADLPGLATDGQSILNSDHALGLQQIPASLCVVGGGVVGCEMAGIFAALGSKVTIVEALDRLIPLPSLNPAASKLVTREFKKKKITSLTAMVVESCQPGPQGVTLNLMPSPLVDHGKRAPKPRELVVDTVLVSVGRRLNTAGLDSAGIELDDRGAVKVSPNFATSLPDVYAVGDMLGTSRPMLAHVAGAEGVAAVEAALGQGRSIDYNAIPQVAYTSPEVAWVGLSPDQARQQGAEILTGSYPLRALGMAQAMGQIAGQVDLVCQAGSGRVLGASVVGHAAGEIIHSCAMAVRLGATAQDLAHAAFAHPTLSEAVQQAAEDALGICLHLPPKR